MARVAGREVPGAPHETLLVLDATVGSNGLDQGREFAKAGGVTGLVLTKLDGTAKGGVAVAVVRELGVPIRYVGVGESGRGPPAVRRRRVRRDALVGSTDQMATADDARWMRRALALAARGLGRDEPEPVVGLRDREGRPRRRRGLASPGGRSARRGAWPCARPAPRPAAPPLYVTLEPCAHRGTHAALRPGARSRPACGGWWRPCAIPNPAVNGRGLAAPAPRGPRGDGRRAGGRSGRAQRALRRGRSRRARPFVLLKAAMTLDGRIATAAGESKWITSPAQRRARARPAARCTTAWSWASAPCSRTTRCSCPRRATRRPFHRASSSTRACGLPLRSRLVRPARRRRPCSWSCPRTTARRRRGARGARRARPRRARARRARRRSPGPCGRSARRGPLEPDGGGRLRGAGRVPRARASSTRSRSSARPCSSAAATAGRRSEARTRAASRDARPARSRQPDLPRAASVWLAAAAMRTLWYPASDYGELEAAMFTGIVEEVGEVAARSGARTCSWCAIARAHGHGRTCRVGGSDRGERLLPDRGRSRSPTASPAS